MIITNSHIDLGSQHQKTEHSIERERLRVWIDNPGQPARQPAAQGAARFRIDQADISARAQAAQPVKKEAELEEAPPLAETKLQALIQLVERLSGKKIKFFDANEMHSKKNPETERLEDPSGPQQQGPRRAGFGIEYDYYSARIEAEHTSFSAQGMVKTADGQEISIEMELNMSRRFMEEQSISIRAGDAQQRLKDPLVLNFNGSAAELSETKFSFDLDADGREDQVSLLNSNSGFLALDKNADGIINDGTELFGAQSGNGFADLSAYDEDGNQWIDEADAIYSKLRIWSRDADGNDQLFALGQKDVGAIYLGNVSTAFDLATTDDNTLLGQVASTGLFLKESGGAGTVQQLNLVV